MTNIDVAAIFANDPRIVIVCVFAGGWAQNACAPCIRTGLEYRRGDGAREMTYDATRAYARGVTWEAYSAQGVLLASG